jgi:hypothetical protein
VRALPEAGSDLSLVLAEQFVDELFAGVAGISSGGYKRLRAEGEMTACFKGVYSLIWFFASSALRRQTKPLCTESA